MNYSPLRYPGGKTKIAPMVKLLIEKSGMKNVTYVEPFAGGAGVSLELLFSGEVDHIVINDYDKAIYSIWRAIIENTNQFVDLIENTEVSIDEWYRQKNIYTNQSNRYSVELAFATFFLNRTNRSGILAAGPIGGYAQNGNYLIDARYNKEELINRILRIAKYRMIHVCNHEEGCLLMAQNMLNRTDELVLNIQGEGQMSIFDLMSDVSTDSSGKQITIQDVKDKMKEHLLNYNTGVHLSRLTAEFYVKYGLIGYISMVNDALKELEKDGYIQIVRQPQFSEKTNKPLKFMDEKGNHNVIIRRLQP